MQSIQLFVNTKPSDPWKFQSASGNTPVFLNGDTDPPFKPGDAVLVDLTGSGTIAGLEGFQTVAGVTGTSLETTVTSAGYFGTIAGNVYYYPEYTELDLIEFEIIRFTKEVSSLEEPARVSSNYTKNFTLPQTSNNGGFFKAVFNVNSTDFDATKSVSAYINIDGILFTTGDLRLNGISVNNKTGLIEYDVIFIGETGSFAGSIGSKLMRELDFSDINHQINYSNISLSWEGYPNGLMGGQVLYPLIEWGYDYDPSTNVPIQSTVAVYNSTTGIKGFTNPANSLLQGQFKPAILLKTLWDKIFKEAGYTYQSDFLNWGNMFDKMYHISTGKYTSGAVLPFGDLVAKYYPYTSSYASRLTVSTTSLNTSTEVFKYIMPNQISSPIYNPSDVIKTQEDAWLYFPNTTPPPVGQSVNLDSPRTYFEIPNNGNYRVVVEQLFMMANKSMVSAELTQNITVFIYKNGLPIDSIQGAGNIITNVTKKFQVTPVTAPSFSFPSTTTYYSLSKGDQIEIRLWRDNYSAGWQPLFISSPETIYSLYTENEGFDLKSMFPQDNYYQIDLIRSLTDKFKLIWEPDPQNPKNFFIEPWITWIKKGRLLDWTHKLNENKDIKIKPLFLAQTRSTTWRDSPESDIYNFSFQQQYKRGFGDVILDSNIQIIAGNKKIETKIAPIMIAPVGNSNTFLVPHLAKDTGTQVQPIEPVPRFCYYNGLIPTPGGITWHILDDAGINSIPQQTYPLVSNFYKEYPNGPTGNLDFNNNAFDISWSNVQQYWDPAFANVNPVNYGNGITYQTAFLNYWYQWYQMTYDKNSRIVESEFSLETNDIRDLRFNDRIWVKDAWYFPISIKDYVLNEKQNVKVELLKVGNLNLQILDLVELEFCYTSESNNCLACCCNETITVYGPTGGTNPATFDQLWFDKQGIVPAPGGWYTRPGATATYYFNNGFQTGDSPCTGCSCTPVLFPLNVCKGYTPQEVCCCVAPSIVIYGNGLNIDTSTQLWGDSVGTIPLDPFTWYKEVTGLAAQVGADGHTVLQYNNCSTIIC